MNDTISKKLKTTKVMPESGQFVAMWQYKGNMWSDNLKWDETDCKRLMTYVDNIEDWIPVPFNIKPYDTNYRDLDVTYYQMVTE